jgi:hypothetical protein
MTLTTWKWKRTSSALIAGAAVALMIGTSAASALAALPTWTVKSGGTVTAKAGKTILIDTKRHQKLTCASSAGASTLKKGTHLSGAGLGLITAVSFSHCTGPFMLQFTVRNGHLPWKLNAVSYNRSTGTTTGTITGIHATLSGPSCVATVDGTGATRNNGLVRTTYVNKTHKLTVLPTGNNLHIYNVHGCLGLINNGDGSSFTTTYAVSPAQTITSP